jgi:hypothetical protein
MKRMEQTDRRLSQAERRMTVRERINKCAKIIFLTHEYLSRYGSKLTSIARNRSMQILAIAETELTHLVTRYKS